jgi:hypothetical protein
MARSVPDLLQSATAAITAARRELDEIERHRAAAIEEQSDAAASLSRSRQLSAELSSVAADALRYQRDQASAMRDAVNERRNVLDKVNADIASLAESLGRSG